MRLGSLGFREGNRGKIKEEGGSLRFLLEDNFMGLNSNKWF
jgi:hypothetical protein